eukprot:4786241-Ditylum_brightwellii.AAC.1
MLKQPQWRTIVISKGTIQTMLHVNCDMKMRWETDILRLHHLAVSPPPGFGMMDHPSSLDQVIIQPKNTSLDQVMIQPRNIDRIEPSACVQPQNTDGIEPSTCLPASNTDQAKDEFQTKPMSSISSKDDDSDET